MASIKVILYTSKLLKNGEHPIMIRFIKDRKPKYISVGHTCHPDQWDFDKELPKRKHPNYRELEILINKKKTEAQKLILNLEDEKQDFSVQEVEQKYRAATKKITVLDYLELLIQRLIEEGRVSYATSHKDLRRVLKQFTKNKDFAFSDIDHNFLRKWEHHFQKQGVSQNTIGVYFRTLRSIFNKAIKEGYAKKAYYPFDEYKVSQFKEQTRKRAITKEEIKKIEALVIEQGSSLYNTQQFFLFSFYCSGMNFKDVAQLQWSNFKKVGAKLSMTYNRSKTNKLFNIQLLSPAVVIYEYYQSVRSNDYMFPFLDSTRHNTPISIENRLKKTKKQVNADLKILAERAGIDENVTTYVARHTFATTLKRSGVSVSMISELMGHDSEKTTQIYLDSFEREDLYEATKNLL